MFLPRYLAVLPKLVLNRTHGLYYKCVINSMYRPTLNKIHWIYGKSAPSPIGRLLIFIPVPHIRKETDGIMDIWLWTRTHSVTDVFIWEYGLLYYLLFKSFTYILYCKQAYSLWMTASAEQINRVNLPRRTSSVVFFTLYCNICMMFLLSSVSCNSEPVL